MNGGSHTNYEKRYLFSRGGFPASGTRQGTAGGIIGS